MSYIEKEKLIKADIASIENRVRHAFNQGYELGFKDGKERTKPLQQEPCEDCISRQAVLDALESIGSLDTEADKKYARSIFESLPSVTPQPKTGHWIPVSERLPEEKQAVLVWCPEYKNIYCAYLEYKKWWIFGAFSQIIPNAVIAWMPLPEPYKAESEG